MPLRAVEYPLSARALVMPTVRQVFSFPFALPVLPSTPRTPACPLPIQRKSQSPDKRYERLLLSRALEHLTLAYTLHSCHVATGHIAEEPLSKNIPLPSPPPFHSHSFLSISLISARFSSKNTFRLYFGANTTWYLQFHDVCAKVFLSMTSFFIDKSSDVFYSFDRQVKSISTHRRISSHRLTSF